MDAYDSYVTKLLAEPKSKIDIERAKDLYRLSHPGEAQSIDGGIGAFAGAIAALKQQGKIRYSMSNWCSIGRHTLPQMIHVTKVKAPKERLTIEWDGRLACLVKGRSNAELSELAKIDAFLKRHRQEPYPVAPLRARSLTIFQDEKRLERYLAADLKSFFGGKVSLDDLACYVPSEIYFATQRYPVASENRVLLVENSETYHVLKNWNQRRQKYKAVAYGAGNAICASVTALPMLIKELDVDAIEYFGDIDQPGFEIPALAISKFSRTNFETLTLPLYPALDLYRACLHMGTPVVSDSYHQRINRWAMETSAQAADWLQDEEVFRAIDRVISSGQRIAQEWVFNLP